MRISITLLLIFFITSCKQEKKTKPNIENKIEVDSVQKSELETPTFNIPDSLELKSLNLNGDFNGDGKMDFSSVVLNKKDGQVGVIIMHNTKSNLDIVFGAGKEINGSTDLRWIEVFEKILKGKTIAPTLVDEETGDIIGPDEKQNFQLIGDGIYMTVEESHGGGIIFWNGKEYQWYHVE